MSCRLLFIQGTSFIVACTATEVSYLMTTPAMVIGKEWVFMKKYEVCPVGKCRSACASPCGRGAGLSQSQTRQTGCAASSPCVLGDVFGANWVELANSSVPSRGMRCVTAPYAPPMKISSRPLRPPANKEREAVLRRVMRPDRWTMSVLCLWPWARRFIRFSRLRGRAGWTGADRMR